MKLAIGQEAQVDACLLERSADLWSHLEYRARVRRAGVRGEDPVHGDRTDLVHVGDLGDLGDEPAPPAESGMV